MPVATLEEVRSAVLLAVKDVTNMDGSALRDDELFSDFGIDSLDRMNLIMVTEKHLGVQLADAQIEHVKSIRTLFDVLQASPGTST